MKFNKILSCVCLFAGLGIATASNILGPENPEYDANKSILRQYLRPFDSTQHVTIDMVRNVLDQLKPQNLNNNINGGQDLFNSTSNLGSNNSPLLHNFTRGDQLEAIIYNVTSMCEQGDNQIVWKAVYGRASQLLDKIQQGAFGNDTNENFERLEHELHALVNINQVVASNYLNPPQNHQQNHQQNHHN